MRFPSLTRLILEKDLRKVFSKLKKGKVLYVGSRDNVYKKDIPHTKFITLDIDPEQNPEIISDIHNIQIKKEQFNTVVAIQVLEHCRDPRKAVQEMKRILKKGGTMIISVPFLFYYHPCPGDYYRFTKEALLDLTKGFKEIEIISNGNFFTAIYEICSVGFLKILLKPMNFLLALLKYKESNNPSNFIVVAKK